MAKTKTTIWICLYAVLIVLTMGIGIFALSNSEISSYSSVYYTATNPVISKEKFKAAFLEFQEEVEGGITSIIFDYYDPETTAFYSPDGGVTKIDFRTMSDSCKRDVSTYADGSINAYRHENNIYVVSSEKITMPANSSAFFCTVEPVAGKALHVSQDDNDLKTVKKLLLRNIDTSKVTSMAYMFFRMSQLEEVDISKFDTSSLSNMGFLFMECTSLKEIDISHFDTSKLGGALYLFRGCTKLVSANISGLDFSHLDSYGLTCMFHSCKNLEMVDMRGINTKGVKSFSMFFLECDKLTFVDDVKGFTEIDTSSATSMAGMFHSCSNVQSLNLNFFDTSKVTDMHQMFNGNRNLQSLDICSWNTSKVTKTAYMFFNCNNLSAVYVGRGWTMQSVTKDVFDSLSYKEIEGDYNMFANCTKLPNWNENKIDGVAVTDFTYAYAGYNSTTKKYGYLTLKN